LKRFHQVIRADGFGGGEIGNRPGDADDAMKAAGGQVQALGRAFEEPAADQVERRVLLQLRAAAFRLRYRRPDGDVSFAEVAVSPHEFPKAPRRKRSG
jgi:hypothetical protein